MDDERMIVDKDTNAIVFDYKSSDRKNQNRNMSKINST